jgi:GNAT superfamily N-acetyltransferase
MTDVKAHSAKYLVEALDNKRHDKQHFACRIESLNLYLKTQASQDIKKNVAVTYVLTSTDTNQIMGYYTLSSIGIFPGDLPADIVKKLPRYPMLPAVLIGRLAVDKKFEGQGIGSMLLMDSFRRTLVLSQQVGLVAVVVDAKNNNANAFYKKNGFIDLSKQTSRLFLPLATIKQLDL